MSNQNDKESLNVTQTTRRHSGAFIIQKEPTTPTKGYVNKIFTSRDFVNSTDNFIFDENIIVLKQGKKKKNYFGKSLTSIMRMEGENKNIPKILLAILSHLMYSCPTDKEIFRINPSDEELAKFVKECNENIDKIYLLNIKHPNIVVAEALVKFLAELPYPIVGDELYYQFLSHATDKSPQDELIKEIHKLSRLNAETLKSIIETLYLLIQGGKVNDISSPLLATIFGPLIFRSKTVNYKMRHKECQICLILIRNYPYIFKMTEEERKLLDRCYNGTFPGPLDGELNRYVFKELTDDEIIMFKKMESNKNLQSNASISLGIVRKKKSLVKNGVLKYKISSDKWKDVFIILKTDKITFFNSKQDWKDGVKQFQSIFFKYAVIEKEEIQDHNYCFSLFCNNLTHYFECKDEDERKDWMIKIVDTINGKYNDIENDIIVKNKSNNDE